MTEASFNSAHTHKRRLTTVQIATLAPAYPHTEKKNDGQRSYHDAQLCRVPDWMRLSVQLGSVPDSESEILGIYPVHLFDFRRISRSLQVFDESSSIGFDRYIITRVLQPFQLSPG